MVRIKASMKVLKEWYGIALHVQLIWKIKGLQLSRTLLLFSIDHNDDSQPSKTRKNITCVTYANKSTSKCKLEHGLRYTNFSLLS